VIDVIDVIDVFHSPKFCFKSFTTHAVLMTFHKFCIIFNNFSPKVIADWIFLCMFAIESGRNPVLLMHKLIISHFTEKT